MRVRENGRTLGTILFVAIACTASCVGQNTSRLPKYVPSPIPGGVIRSWGDDAMADIMAAWETTFRRYHPDIAFETTLDGSGTGMAGIITGVSDLALMGRAASANEVMGFEWVFRYKPLGIQVMSGGLAKDGRTPALVVFVSKENPVRQIKISTLAAILACPNEPSKPVTWAAAGAQGLWANKHIHAYLYDSGTGTGAFLQQAVLGSEDRWNWEIVKEFKDSRHPNGTLYPAGQQIVDALRRDPVGIGISTLGYSKPWVSVLSLEVGGSVANATEKSVIEESYPLSRGVYIYVNKAPGKPLDARVQEFLRFVTSQEGQALVWQQKDFLPLSNEIDLQQRKKIE